MSDDTTTTDDGVDADKLAWARWRAGQQHGGADQPAVEPAAQEPTVETDDSPDDFAAQLDRLDAARAAAERERDEVRERADALEAELEALRAAQTADTPPTQPDTPAEPAAAVSGDLGPQSGDETGSGTVEPDDDASTGRRKGVRERLTAAETAAAELADRLARQQAAVFTDAVQRAGIDTTLAAAAGISVDQFTGEDGSVDAAAITAAADAVRVQYGIARRPAPTPAVGRGSDTVTPPATWGGVLSRAARKQHQG